MQNSTSKGWFNWVELAFIQISFEEEKLEQILSLTATWYMWRDGIFSLTNYWNVFFMEMKLPDNVL